MKNKIAIITPAYNEEKNLNRLADSIFDQKLLPAIWVIVNDDSTDETAQIIDNLASEHSFIHAVHNKKSHGTKNYYAHKINAFNKGYEYLRKLGVDYDFVGNLDADISMDSDYYLNIINEFEINEKLGIAGGSYWCETKKKFWKGLYVPGSILVARRNCLEEIGGYKPLKYGAEDTLLCVEAEVAGWDVKSFTQYQVVQHRLVGSAENKSSFKIFFRQGLGDQKLGYSFIYQLARIINGINKDHPFFLASFYRLIGFLTGFFTEPERSIPSIAKAHLKKKQSKRLIGHIQP